MRRARSKGSPPSASGDRRALGDPQAVAGERGNAERGQRAEVGEEALRGLAGKAVDEVDVDDEPRCDEQLGGGRAPGRPRACGARCRGLRAPRLWIPMLTRPMPWRWITSRWACESVSGEVSMVWTRCPVARDALEDRAEHLVEEIGGQRGGRTAADEELREAAPRRDPLELALEAAHVALHGVRVAHRPLPRSSRTCSGSGSTECARSTGLRAGPRRGRSRHGRRLVCRGGRRIHVRHREGGAWNACKGRSDLANHIRCRGTPPIEDQGGDHTINRLQPWEDGASWRRADATTTEARSAGVVYALPGAGVAVYCGRPAAPGLAPRVPSRLDWSGWPRRTAIQPWSSRRTPGGRLRPNPPGPVGACGACFALDREVVEYPAGDRRGCDRRHGLSARGLLPDRARPGHGGARRPRPRSRAAVMRVDTRARDGRCARRRVTIRAPRVGARA